MIPIFLLPVILIFFLKPSSSILIPGAGPVLRPKGVSLHYEVELGLVIGKTLRDLDPEDKQGALDAIQSEYPAFSFPLRLLGLLIILRASHRLCSRH